MDGNDKVRLRARAAVLIAYESVISRSTCRREFQAPEAFGEMRRIRKKSEKSAG